MAGMVTSVQKKRVVVRGGAEGRRAVGACNRKTGVDCPCRSRVVIGTLARRRRCLPSSLPGVPLMYIQMYRMYVYA